jgi:CubicO group peptidase (beta-lactamase class C family)
VRKRNRCIFIFISLCFLNVLPCGLTAGFSSVIPETPAGKRMKESLDLINSGDIQKIREYISTQFTRGFLKLFGEERLFDVYYGFFEKYGGLDFFKARESFPHKLDGVHRCRLTGSGYLFGLTVVSRPPHKIQGMTILPLAHPNAPKSLESLSEDEKIEMLESFMDKLGEAEVFSGAALLAREGDILFKKAYGMADREKNIANSLKTKFNLASLNKMFTSVAAAQLCEEGKLSYDDPIGKYLGPNWIPADIGNKVRIKHLLSHTSGIGIAKDDDNLAYLEEAFKRNFRKIDDYKYFSANAKLKFEPGSEYSYSNMGMHLLGPIIEKISGVSYYQYLQEHIFDPLGMSDTAFCEMDRPEPNMAEGYVKESKEEGFTWKRNDYAGQLKGTPAGGAYATIDDLFKFEKALRNHMLVSEKTRDDLFTAKKELNANSYGFGFSVRQFDGQYKVGHTGGYVGINNYFSMYLNNGYTVILLSNVDLISGSVDSGIEFFVTSLFFGENGNT